MKFNEFIKRTANPTRLKDWIIMIEKGTALCGIQIHDEQIVNQLNRYFHRSPDYDRVYDMARAFCYRSEELDRWVRVGMDAVDQWFIDTEILSDNEE